MRPSRLPISRIRSRPGSTLGVVVLVVVGVIVFVGGDEDATRRPTPDSPPDAEPSLGPPAADPARARVLRVLDGDTIVVSLAGTEERVRYIGIDTPETAKRGAPVECYAEEAARRNEALVGGVTVTLEFDRELRDRFGRLLAYVSTGERGVNEELVRAGFARTLAIEPNTARAKRLARLELAAGRAGQGLWGACDR